jgi:hypothetical protein
VVRAVDLAAVMPVVETLAVEMLAVVMPGVPVVGDPVDPVDAVRPAAVDPLGVGDPVLGRRAVKPDVMPVVSQVAVPGAAHVQVAGETEPHAPLRLDQ